jgi:hypothetical protein
MNLNDLITKQLTEFGDDITAAKADGKLEWSEGKTIATRAIGRCLGVVTALGDTGEEVEKTVTAATEKFFDTYIVPLDIPWVPEFVEKMIEGSVRQEIPGMVRNLLGGVIEGFKAAKAAA